MKKSAVIVFAAALALAVPAAAQTTPPATPASAASRQSALDALQDARKTMSSLTEESMSHGRRTEFDRLTSSFRGLYKAYTGHEPDERKSASQAALGDRPSADWPAQYATTQKALDDVIGTSNSSSKQASRTSQPPAVGTAGHGGAQASTASTQPVRDDLLTLRQQLQRFYSQAHGPDSRGMQKK